MAPRRSWSVGAARRIRLLRIDVAVARKGIGAPTAGVPRRQRAGRGPRRADGEAAHRWGVGDEPVLPAVPGAVRDPRRRAASGRAAEEIAARHLAARGFAILDRNVRRRGSELDIVARDGGEIVFVEVRSRRRGSLFDPAATVGPRKRRALRRAAVRWLAENGLGDAFCRFDLVAVSVAADGYRLRHLRGVFVAEDGA